MYNIMYNIILLLLLFCCCLVPVIACGGEDSKVHLFTQKYDKVPVLWTLETMELMFILTVNTWYRLCNYDGPRL